MWCHNKRYWGRLQSSIVMHNVLGLSEKHKVAHHKAETLSSRVSKLLFGSASAYPSKKHSALLFYASC